MESAEGGVMPAETSLVEPLSVRWQNKKGRAEARPVRIFLKIRS
jgi:hypothetical protein